MSLLLPALVFTAGVGAVAVGNGPGWVSGNLAAMPANATGDAIFDLGNDWARYHVVTVALTATQPVSAGTVYGSDDGAAKAGLMPTMSGGGAALVMAAAGDLVVSIRPTARYLMINVSNGATVQGGGSRVRVVAHPTL